MRIFYHTDGRASPLPTSLADACDAGLPAYTTGTRCPACDAELVRYVGSGACLSCARLDAIHAYNALCAGLPVTAQHATDAYRRAEALLLGVDWPRMPASQSEARAWGAGVWLSPEACRTHGHIGLQRVADGQCWYCAADAQRMDMRRQTQGNAQITAAPEQIISRESARAQGLVLYRTGRACRKGHTGHRYVSTGHCVQCQRGL